jgi:hypothetical protein
MLKYYLIHVLEKLIQTILSLYLIVLNFHHDVTEQIYLILLITKYDEVFPSGEKADFRVLLNPCFLRDLVIRNTLKDRVRFL